MHRLPREDFCDNALRIPSAAKNYFSHLRNYNTTKDASLHHSIRKNVKKLWRELPVFALTINRRLDAKGFCILQGFSVKGKQGDLCLLSLALLLGTPTATDVVDKKIIWPVKPVHYAAGRLTTISEDAYTADLHTDTQYFPHPEKYVMLACIKPAETGGVTTLVDGREVIASMQKTEKGRNVLEVLRKRKFPIRIPTSYTKLRKDDVPEAIFSPLISNTPLIRFRIDTIVRGIALCPKLVTEEMTFAVRYFHNALENHPSKKSYKLKSGEILIVNNHFMLHGRTKFNDSRRLLKRIRIQA